MKEFVLVEFLFTDKTFASGMEMLEGLESDFELVKSDVEWDYTDPSDADFYRRVAGKINSMAAAVIRLRHPKLTESMHISYISEDLKNKYRR